MKVYGGNTFVSRVVSLLVCIVFSVMAVYMIVDTVSFAINADLVTGEVVSIEYERSSRNGRGGSKNKKVMYVSYDYNGGTYTNQKISNDVPGMIYEGKDMVLYVDSENPTDVRTSWISGSALLMCVVFVGVVVLLVYISNVSSKKKGKEKSLKNGNLLMATIDEIIVDPTVEVNHKKRNCIKCSYCDRFTGERYEFISDKVWDYLDDYFKIGDQIPVYVEPNNYSKYYVDIESKMRNFSSLSSEL